MLGNLKVFLAILVFGLIERVWFCMRLSYLRTRQKKVNLDFSKEVALGYAFWSYSVQAILFIFCIIALTQFFSTQNHAIAKYMYLAMFVFMLILAFGSLVPRLKTSVNIGVGKQISYITFSRQRTIHADQIISYTVTVRRSRLTVRGEGVAG